MAGKRTIKVTVRLNEGEWEAALRAGQVLSPHVELADAQLVRELMVAGIRSITAKNSGRKKG